MKYKTNNKKVQWTVGKLYPKKAQVTIFIILALILVVSIVILFVVFRSIGPELNIVDAENPQLYIDSCVGDVITEAVDKILENGGYVQLPGLRMSFLGEEISYLCYTEVNYARCIPLAPVMIEHLEDEIANYAEPYIKGCFDSLKLELESESYRVDFGDMNFEVDLIIDNINVNIDMEVVLSKVDFQRKFKSFKVNEKSPLYDIGIIVHEIIRQEALYCNSNYLQIMQFNKMMEIDKTQTGDDNRIYNVRDIKTGREIMFAIKGCNLVTPS